MIDLQRLEVLIKGDDTPNNLGEEMFLESYTKATEGDLLFSYLRKIGDTLDELNIDELHMVVLGYAMGQHDLETEDFVIANNDGNTRLN